MEDVRWLVEHGDVSEDDDEYEEEDNKEESGFKPCNLSIEEAIQKHGEENGYDPFEDEDLDEIDNEEDETQSEIDNAQVEYLKNYDNNNTVTKVHPRKSHYRDVKQIAKIDVSILKEAGRPMKSKEIIDKL